MATSSSPNDAHASLSIDNSNASQEEDEVDLTAPPLDQRILDIIKTCKKKDGDHNFIIQPARLSAELGISVEDATAELCGLLAAVGGGHEGASFSFERTTTSAATSAAATMTMVFTFPPDFEARAKSKRRREDFKESLREMFFVFLKALKILTAFGLILSLCILTIAAMIGLVVAIVAMSRTQQGGGNQSHQRNLLWRQLRALFYTFRQLLWFYALFGREVEGQDPFLSEMAYDMALLSSICCVRPGSFFWWYRVSQMNRRRQRARRGWNRGLWGSSSNTTSRGNGNELESDIEGVQLIRRGDRHEDQRQQLSTQEDEQRGLLSVAVEYLFGPSPFDPGPSEADKWKLRGAVIVQLSSSQKEGSPGVSLEDLSPYLDDPPKGRDEEITKTVAGGLEIVAHFNGVPAVNEKEEEGSTAIIEPHKARFYFPELMAESQYATRYEPSQKSEDHDDGSFECLLYTKSNFVGLGGQGNSLRTGESVSASLPTCLYEQRYKFTKLQSQQFFYCVTLGVINLVGVVWLRASLEPPNGMLQLPDGTLLATVIKRGLSPMLFFYAKLFFMLPGARLILILVLNAMRKTRNEKRKLLCNPSSD